MVNNKYTDKDSLDESKDHVREIAPKKATEEGDTLAAQLGDDARTAIRERLRQGEDPEIIKASAITFTKELIALVPQVEGDKLNYYLAGSLGLMLIAAAGSFDLIDPDALPRIELGTHQELPSEARDALQRFIRKVGDLDYVRVGDYGRMAGGKKLGKGGSYPQKKHFSAVAHTMFKKGAEGGIGWDPLGMESEHRVVRVKVDGQEIYVTDPLMVVGYKALHFVESFRQFAKREKFVHDLETMLDAFEELYGRKTLVKLAHRLLVMSQPGLMYSNCIPYGQRHFTDRLAFFFDEVLAADEDASYLIDLKHSRERSLGVLKVLHHFENPAHKRAIIDFIKRHQEVVDRSFPSSASDLNQKLIVESLQEDGVTRAKFLELLEREHKTLLNPPAIVLADFLQLSILARSLVIDVYEPQSALEMSLKNADVFRVLVVLDKKSFEEEMQQLDRIATAHPSYCQEYNLWEILRSKNLADMGIRKQIFQGIVYAAEQLDIGQRDIFLAQLKNMICDDRWYPGGGKPPKKITPQKRPNGIKWLFKKYGVPFKESENTEE